MKRKILLFAVLNLTLFIPGCEIFDDSIISLTSAAVIENIEINDRMVKVRIGVGTPSPCYVYYKYETTHTAEGYIVRIYGKSPNIICEDQVGSFKANIYFDFESPGEKRLKFWQWGDRFLDTTITVY